MSFVYVSYARADRDYATALADYLHGNGVAIWFDPDSDGAGHWEQSGRAQVEGCAQFVLVLSPAALASPSVAREVDHAIAHRKPFRGLRRGGDVPATLAWLPPLDVSDGRLPGPEFAAGLRAVAPAPIGTPPPGLPAAAAAAPAGRSRRQVRAVGIAVLVAALAALAALAWLAVKAP